MAALVVGSHLLLRVAHHQRTALGAHQHLVLGVLELEHRHRALAHAGRQQRRLVHQVGEVRTREAGGAAGDGLGLDVGRQRHLLHVHAQDLLAAVHVRVRHHHLAVEPAWTKQRRVQHVRTVGGSDQDHPLVALEAVHLDQHLVEGLLALVVAAAEAGAAMAADRVDLVDEDDAGRALLALLEHVADAGRADAHEHLHEVRAGDGEERHVGLTGDGARQQRLAGAGRAHQQHALGDLAAQALELLRVLEEVHDLLELGLGLVDAGYVLEGDAALLLGQQLGARLAEAHGAAAAGLHLAHHEEPGADNEKQRRPLQQIAEQGVDVAVLGLGYHLDALASQARHQAGILGRVGLERRAVGQHAGHVVVLDHDGPDVACVHVADEVGIGQLLCRPLAAARLEHAEQQHQQQRDDDPEGQVPPEIAHLRLPLPRSTCSRSRPPHGTGGMIINDRRAEATPFGTTDWDDPRLREVPRRHDVQAHSTGGEHRAIGRRHGRTVAEAEPRPSGCG